MTTKVRKALLGVAAVAGLAGILYGCGLVGKVQFTISFRTPAGQVISCAEAQLSTIQFTFFDLDINAQKATVRQPCDPNTANNLYTVSDLIGNYNVTVDGLDSRQTICYTATVGVQIVSGQTAGPYQLVANPTGGDCQYPQ